MAIAARFHGWGGARPRAGRPRATRRSNVPHRRRAEHCAEHPVLLTFRTTCRSLRTQYVFPTIRIAIARMKRSRVDGFRVCQFSVQGDHVHFIVEASSGASLARGARGLAIRMALAVNRLLMQRGAFLADRYHTLELKTRRAVRNALVYVLGNFRKHGRAKRGEMLDVYSSAPYFRGFKELNGKAPYERDPGIVPRVLSPPKCVPVEPAETWLLKCGWQLEGGAISVSEEPRRDAHPLRGCRPHAT